MERTLGFVGSARFLQLDVLPDDLIDGQTFFDYFYIGSVHVGSIAERHMRLEIGDWRFDFQSLISNL